MQLLNVHVSVKLHVGHLQKLSIQNFVLQVEI